MIIDSRQYNGKCACGQTHEMVTKAAIIEEGCLADFENYMAQYGVFGKRAAIYDRNTYHAENLIRPQAEQEIVLNPENLHANEISTATVLEKLDEDVKVLIAVGGGTVHDTTRYCAHERGIPFISCPTAASVDGFCSTVAAMTWYGFKKTLPAVAPLFVLADLNVIKAAPPRLALSGFGDIIGKYTALADWRISEALYGEKVCDTIEQMTRKATEAVKNSAEGLVEGKTKAFEELTYGLILSGLAMQLMGNSRPASGVEHHISHLIEMEPEGLSVHSDALHGEKVGVGCILAAREYHRLAAIENIADHVVPYEPMTEEWIKEMFGERLYRDVVAENKNDKLTEVTPEMLINAWEDIRNILREIPTAEELTALYREIGAKTTLEDIGVDSSKTEKLLQYAPCVRARNTLLRVRRMIK